MKHIDSPYIKKTYELDPQELIVIYLEDVRDNYVEEDALGKIGRISIGKGYMGFDAEVDEESKIALKEQILVESYQEIFGKKAIDFRTNMHYEMIKSMIEDGTLETFGYTKSELPEDIEDYSYSTKDLDDDFTNYTPDDEMPESIYLENLEPRRHGRR